MSFDPYPPPRHGAPPSYEPSPPYDTTSPYGTTPPYDATPAYDTTSPYDATPTYAVRSWQPVGHHSDLRVLRGAYRRQRRTATFTALGYFLLFLGLSAFAPSSLTGDVTDGLPLGLLLALLQLPVTWLAIALYEHTARRTVDPLADRIRHDSEVDARRGAAR
ncbi:DUF485 domain-containing protein [Streptomyces flaveolus]|jgi:uncharacterized membrane protein (DUF485 family)|uniref:DUF485 domain-containing protein n=1 Tax=Streptomyces flaveolus TaxID=67297 RepID=UPI0016712B70|nr:DUF485 domain-containing protein [Streptomyces flaveolus]GGQ89018.1 hypothetical protein GCM10010216_59180 [Streptomyces flaveolus]